MQPGDKMTIPSSNSKNNNAQSTIDRHGHETTDSAKPMSWLGRFRRSTAAVLLVACLAVFTDMLTYGVVIPLITDLLERVGYGRGFNAVSGTTLFATYAAGLFVATPIFGIVSDRLANRQIPMLVGLCGLIITTILFTVARSFQLLVVARVFQGISAAASWVVGMAMVTDTFPANRLGFPMSIVLSFNTLGFLLGPLIGGILSSKFSLETPFYVCAGLAALDFFARCFVIPPKPLSYKKRNTALLEHQSAKKKQINPTPQQSLSLLERLKQINFVVLLSHTEILLLAITVVIASASLSTVEALVSLYLVTRFGVTVEQTTLSVCAFIVPSIASSIVIGFVSDHIPRTRIMMLGSLLHATAPPFLALANTIWQFNLAAVYMGITSSLFLAPVMPEMASRTTYLGHTSSYARIYAIYNICYSLGMLVGPFAAAALAHKHGFFAAMLIVPTALAVFTPFYILYTLKMERKRTGLDWSWSAVFSHFMCDIANLKRDAPLPNSRAASLVEVVVPLPAATSETAAVKESASRELPPYSASHEVPPSPSNHESIEKSAVLTP